MSVCSSRPAERRRKKSEEEIASKEEIRELIQRVKSFNAHDDERCDHQIETKMHCGLCSKAFCRPAPLLRQGRGPNSWVTGDDLCWISLLSRVRVIVNNLPRNLFLTRVARFVCRTLELVRRGTTPCSFEYAERALLEQERRRLRARRDNEAKLHDAFPAQSGEQKHQQNRAAIRLTRRH
jgi:hypothetical protein